MNIPATVADTKIVKTMRRLDIVVGWICVCFVLFLSIPNSHLVLELFVLLRTTVSESKRLRRKDFTESK